MFKKVIFTISKNSDLRRWQEYHISKDFEIFVINNGNITYNNHSKLHILFPDYSQDILGHVNQQEYLMNMFYKNYKEEALIYFIDDDEYIVENEYIKGNTYLNWKIYNGSYYPNTHLNMFFKPVVKTNQNVHICLHNIVFLESDSVSNTDDSKDNSISNINEISKNISKADSIRDSNDNSIRDISKDDSKDNLVRDGNNNVVDANIQFIKEQSFKNYIIHYQYTSLEELSKKVSMRPSYEQIKYLKIRTKGFYECCDIKSFHMCIILDNYNIINIIRKIYPRLTFFIITSIIPLGADIEIIPNAFLKCPEQYIFKYAEENSLDIIIKRASKININDIDFKNEYKDVDMYKSINHYKELQFLNSVFENNLKDSHSTHLFMNLKRFKEYGMYDYLDIIKINQFIDNFKELSFESKSFKIIVEFISKYFS